jgi:hypothetical protein
MTGRYPNLAAAESTDVCLPGGDGHGPGPAEYLQLDGGALYAGDAQRHPPVMDLVVGELLLGEGSGWREEI